MLDEPSISRQWVARRLQRALSMERWCGALREGFGQKQDRTGQILRAHSGNAESRALRLESMIRETGSEPYGSWGLGFKATARLGGSALAHLSLRLMYQAAELIAEHTLSEYVNLMAFLEDATGIDRALPEAIKPMHLQALVELEELKKITLEI